MAGSNIQVSKPMSVKEISSEAQDFDFNPFIALKYWLRTADALLREVRISIAGGPFYTSNSLSRHTSMNRRTMINKLISFLCDMRLS